MLIRNLLARRGFGMSRVLYQSPPHSAIAKWGITQKFIRTSVPQIFISANRSSLLPLGNRASFSYHPSAFIINNQPVLLQKIKQNLAPFRNTRFCFVNRFFFLRKEIMPRGDGALPAQPVQARKA
jgi:hypothetical protein